MAAALQILCLLLVGHALCDYPLQGDFLARGKNHRNPLPGVPWQHCLAAHAVIHAGAVTFITGSYLLGFFELVLHALIDYFKSEGVYGEGAHAFNKDQFTHLFCKLAWVAGWMLLR